MLCGSSAPHLRNVAYGYKHASAELAINIERESKGAVPAESVRPDVDWSVIRNSPTPSRGSRQ
jgi:DNA-binding transcriptional regulator YdaS (Cro superfamily)